MYITFFKVLNNLWTPPVNYEFPTLKINSKRNLKFQYRWLETYSWLCYSKKFEGAFCKYCVVFTKVGGVGSQKLGGLVLTAYQNWKNALEVITFIFNLTHTNFLYFAPNYYQYIFSILKITINMNTTEHL